MTQKHKHPPPLSIEDPPTSSSSDEDEEQQQPSSQQQHIEEVSSSEEGEESPSQEEDNQQPPTNPHPKPKPKPSSSESDSKPTEQAQKPKPQPSPESPKSIPKRPAQNNAHVTDPKRAKKKPPGASFSSTATATAAVAASDDATEEDREKSGGGGGQTKFFQRRLFSEEDELAILKGIPEFISRTGQDPYKYIDAFRNFVEKSLRVEASSSQLKEKIRRLKKKFETKARKKGRNGEDPVFSRSHDRTVFELSKKAWGEGATGLLVEMPKPNGKRKTAKTLKKEAASRNVVAKSETKTLPEPMELEDSGKPDSGDVNVNLLYRQVSGFKELDEDEMKRGLALIGESNRKELEGKWKKLQLAEIELFANRSLLIGEQIKLIFEALQSSNH